MTKKTATDDKDTHLFHEAMKFVKPLKPQNRVQHAQKPTLPPKRQAPLYDDEIIPLHEASAECVSGDESVQFHRPGVQTSYLRKLKRGQIAYADSLDLHQMTILEARDAVERFVLLAQKNEIRCIKIVHGKGKMAKTDKPVLKNKLNRWLRGHPFILAFCSALPKDGGTGAVYILLKKS